MAEPAIINLGRKSGLVAECTTGKAFRIVLATALVHILECEDVCFGTDREILLPNYRGGADSETETERITGLGVVATALQFAERFTDKRLLCAGHTDTTGSTKHNLSLSTERARNVQLYLSGRRSEWAAHCQEHYEVADIQQVHKWAAKTRGWDCDPGEVDNEFGDKTRKARNVFREMYNLEFGGNLKQGVKQSQADWEAIYDLYDLALAALLELGAADLAHQRSRLRFTDPTLIGCGEHFPTENPGVDNSQSAVNRRVDLLFFDESELPSSNGGEPPGTAIYAGETFARAYIPVDIGERTLFELHVYLLNSLGARMAETKWQVSQENRILDSGTADAEGRAIAKLMDKPDTVTFAWGERANGESGSFMFQQVYLASLSDDPTEAARQRLAHLGYSFYEDERANVLHLQRALGLEDTGKLEDVSELLQSWHDDGAHPDAAKIEIPIRNEEEFDIFADPGFGFAEDEETE